MGTLEAIKLINYSQEFVDKLPFTLINREDKAINFFSAYSLLGCVNNYWVVQHKETKCLSKMLERALFDTLSKAIQDFNNSKKGESCNINQH